MSLKPQAGFTLVELMVTIAVMAIGLALAMPTFTEVIRSNRVAAATNSFIAAFNLARTEAVRSNRGAVVCASSAGTSCDGSNWNVGILAFADNDATGTWSDGDTAIRYFQSSETVQLSSSSASTIAFDRRGRASANAEISIKPAECKSGADQQRRIYIKTSGQTRLQKETC